MDQLIAVLAAIKDWQPSWTILLLWLYFDKRHRKTETILANHKHADDGKPVHIGNPSILHED